MGKQLSWINGDYAIWYYPGYWIIGNLADIGQFLGYMYAINDVYELTDDENEWKYWDGSSWISSSWISRTVASDIQITCMNNK